MVKSTNLWINIKSIDEYIQYSETSIEITNEITKDSVVLNSAIDIKDSFFSEKDESVEKPKLTKDMLTKLVDFAYADKRYAEIHYKELSFLFELAEELNLSEDDMNAILINWKNKKYKDIPLSHWAEGVLYFIYEIHLSRQDGVITDVERNRIYEQAKKIWIWTPKVKIIIDEWLDTLQRDDKKREKIESLHKEIMDSINYARFIQDAMLPSKEEMDAFLPEYFLWDQPKDTVSGDFYWLNKQWNKTMVAVADATWHGVSGALLSFLGIAGLEEAVNKTSIVTEILQLVDKFESLKNENEDLRDELTNKINTSLAFLKIIKNESEIEDNDLNPALVLDELRMYIKKRLNQWTSLSNSNNNGMDMSFVSLKEGADGRFESLEFAWAFNNLYVVRGKELIILSADRFPVGIYDPIIDKLNFKNYHLDLKKGDMIYMFSDGYQDQIWWVKNKKFKIKNLKETLMWISQISVEEQKEILKSNMRNRIDWGEEEQLDDILFMWIRV